MQFMFAVPVLPGSIPYIFPYTFGGLMPVWILVLVLLGSLTVYEVGKLGVIASISLGALKFIAIALVIGALILLYRKFRARKRGDRHRRLLP